MSLSGQNLTVVAGKREILSDASLTLRAGEVVVIVGPNGAGKSTLLRALSGETRPANGTVTLNGRNLSDWSADELALQRAVLPQSPTLAFPFRVCDVVELGRYPHRGSATGEDHRIAISSAMHAADVGAMALRDCRTLSGGELHRVHFARTLAQVWTRRHELARFLLLDEPTSSLDLAHQGLVLSRAKSLTREGAGVLAILHDLNLAAAYADRIVVMDKGRIIVDGIPDEILTEDLIRAVWGVESEFVTTPATGRKSIILHHSLPAQFSAGAIGEAAE